MLLTSQVVLVCIFAKVRLLASAADLFEGCPRGGGCCRSLVRKDFFGKNLRSERRKRGYSALEVVSAGKKKSDFVIK